MSGGTRGPAGVSGGPVDERRTGDDSGGAAGAGDGFAAATAVTPLSTAPAEPGSSVDWSAELPADWDVPTGIHGGMLLAAGLRAAEGTLASLGDPATEAQVLRSVHASFVARPTAHRLEIAAAVRRSGGTTSHVDVSVSSEGSGREALAVRAMYGRPLEDPEAWDEIPDPGVPHPDTGDPAEAAERNRRQWPGPFPPLFDHLDLRPAVGVLPWEPEWEPGAPARYARWARWRVPPVGADGALDPLSLLPLADLPAPSLWVRYGPDRPMRALLSLEMAVEVLAPALGEWVLCDFRSRHLRDGYLQVDAELFSAGRPVLAVRQTMLTRELPASWTPQR